MTTVETTTTTTETEPVSTTKVVEETMNGDKKEEESTSTSTSTSTTTQQTITPTTNSDDHQNEQILLQKGTKLIEEENYNEAVPLLSNALELIQQKDIATNIEAVQYYMAYGEGLLRLVQSCNDLFAAPVRDVQQQHLEQQQNEEEVDQEEVPQLITDATEPTSATTEDDKVENGKEEKSENPKEEQESDEDDDLPQPQAQGAAAAGDVDTSEDREIAWETFEYARSIIEEFLSKPENTQNDKYLEMLAKCHSFLGELLIEDENNEMALTEFEKALEIQDKCSKDVINCRQRAFNHFMACLAAQFCEKDESALNHCNIALKGLSERICEMLQEMECTEEMKEDNDYQNVIQIAESFVDKKEETEQVKELKHLLGVMQDLMSKLEEVEQIIKVKKEQPVNMGGGDGYLGGLMDGNDALQSLIMGLTSKFGIDEQELNELEEEEDENKNNQNVGITTVGFGNVEEVDGDEEVNDLGCFGKTKKEKKAGKKRSMEDADIDNDDEMNAAKKMKLNSGDAAAVENEEEKK